MICLKGGYVGDYIYIYIYVHIYFFNIYIYICNLAMV